LLDITSSDVDRWRNTWIFREESYSLKNSNARIKAFFTWAVKFEHLDKNPLDKLDKLKLTPVPTLPLSEPEYKQLLHAAASLKQRRGSLHHTLVNLILLMRWSGLSILDACCLRRDALKGDNLRTYRQKINKAQAGPDGYVYIKIPHELAERLRAQLNSHPDYFFWHGRGLNKSFAHTMGYALRRAYNLKRLHACAKASALSEQEPKPLWACALDGVVKTTVNLEVGISVLRRWPATHGGHYKLRRVFESLRFADFHSRPVPAVQLGTH
jgi:integrase